MKGQNANKTETVKVAVRVRPMNTLEKKSNSINCVDVDKNNNQITINKTDTNDTKTFQYDFVYPIGTPQRQIYDELGFPLVESVFEGYNGTIFAYGQTGCGKTFTMMGEYNDPDLRGIIPNAFSHIFGYISNEGSLKKFLVRCTFLEIYNEDVRDLLGKDSSKKLEVREDPKTGIFVKDLNYIIVKNSAELENALTIGHKNRHTGETAMNQESSRSHCIFTVYIEIGENMQDEKNRKIRAGKLNLVDLAGSERQSKTQATGVRLDEAKKINLSLSALSNVINALVENKSHIPYRDSKLTRLLQDSLGGNTKTVMIAAISPSSYNYEETLSTLRYAARANAIKNAPKINEDPKDALLRDYEEQIQRLKEQLAVGGGGAVFNSGNEDEFIKRLENEKLKMESNLREKEELLQANNLEKEKMLQRIKEMEKEIDRKFVYNYKFTFLD
jgi:kinesin family protein 3/17